MQMRFFFLERERDRERVCVSQRQIERICVSEGYTDKKRQIDNIYREREREGEKECLLAKD